MSKTIEQLCEKKYIELDEGTISEYEIEYPVFKSIQEAIKETRKIADKQRQTNIKLGNIKRLIKYSQFDPTSSPELLIKKIWEIVNG